MVYTVRLFFFQYANGFFLVNVSSLVGFLPPEEVVSGWFGEGRFRTHVMIVASEKLSLSGRHLRALSLGRSSSIRGVCRLGLEALIHLLCGLGACVPCSLGALLSMCCASSRSELDEAQPCLDHGVAGARSHPVLGKNRKGGEAERCLCGRPCRNAARDRSGIKIRWLWRKRVSQSRRLVVTLRDCIVVSGLRILV